MGRQRPRRHDTMLDCAAGRFGPLQPASSVRAAVQLPPVAAFMTF